MKTRKVNPLFQVLCILLTLIFSNNEIFSQPTCISAELENDFPSGIARLGCDSYDHSLWSTSLASTYYVYHPSETYQVFKLSVQRNGSNEKTVINPGFVNGQWVSITMVTTNDQVFIEPINFGKAEIGYKTLGPQCYTQYTGRTFEVVAPSFSKNDVGFHIICTVTNGNLNGNDDASSQLSYNTPILISSPIGSAPSINVSSDGTYNFTSNIAGTYVYEVQSCNGTCCTPSTLTIHAINKYHRKTIYAQDDYTNTTVNKPVNLISLTNDACINNVQCHIDPTTVEYIDVPSHGTLTVANQAYIYTPDNDYIGTDKITYRVCSDNTMTQCDTAIQYITVLDTASPNDTYADDDYVIGMRDSVVSGNLLVNDHDAQGNQQSATPQTTTNMGCTLDLQSDGSYTFTPAKGFYGQVSFSYQVCDDNQTVSACDNASIQFLVMTPVEVNVRTYLQGALIQATGFASDGRILMRDDLRVSPFNGKRYIPMQNPYQFPVLNASSLVYDLSGSPELEEKFKEVACGSYPQFMGITDTAVFKVTGQNAIVDWIMVELRNANDMKQVLATRAGLLQRDGDIVDLDGISPLAFPDVELNNYFVSVKHRNHLGVMSKNALTAETYTKLVDFTKSTLPTYDKGIVNNIDYRGLATFQNYKLQYNCMFAGDFDANGIVKADGPDVDLNVLVIEVISMSNNALYGLNYDGAIGYFASDFNMNSKAKFDSPYDDKNMLLGQVLFYYANIHLLLNFDGMIEQLP